MQTSIAPVGPAPLDAFGSALAFDQSTAVIAANPPVTAPSGGRVRVFVRAAGLWSQQAEFVPAPVTAGHEFGESVALHGDTVIAGAPHDDAPADDSGSAFVHTRTAGDWAQQAKLTAADGSADARFGWSVAADGDTVVVGAPGHDGPAGNRSGAAYVLVRSGV